MLLDKLFTDPCRMCYRLFCGGSRAPSAPSFKESKSSRQRHGERINLERLLPSLHRLLRRFFFRLTVQARGAVPAGPSLRVASPVLLEPPSARRPRGTSLARSRQEPTFSEVVVVYAEVVPNEPPRLCLKSFRDIPMADIEVVFPGVTVCASHRHRPRGTRAHRPRGAGRAAQVGRHRQARRYPRRRRCDRRLWLPVLAGRAVSARRPACRAPPRPKPRTTPTPRPPTPGCRLDGARDAARSARPARLPDVAVRRRGEGSDGRLHSDHALPPLAGSLIRVIPSPAE